MSWCVSTLTWSIRRRSARSVARPLTAEDLTQAVFTELAHSAPRLVRHTALTGWLYTTTRFLAAKARRAEQRRHAREQEAYMMNQLLQPSNSHYGADRDAG